MEDVRGMMKKYHQTLLENPKTTEPIHYDEDFPEFTVEFASSSSQQQENDDVQIIEKPTTPTRKIQRTNRKNQPKQVINLDSSSDSDYEFEESTIISEDEQYESSSETEELDSLWSRKDAKKFQSCLITLLLFVIGGQRKQIVTWFALDVSFVLCVY